MFKYRLITFTLLAAALACGQAHGQRVETIKGKVIKVDAEGGVIFVNTDDGPETFFVMTESDMYMSAHHMSSIEMEKGDPVTIDYVEASGKYNIVKLVDSRSNG